MLLFQHLVDILESVDLLELGPSNTRALQRSSSFNHGGRPVTPGNVQSRGRIAAPVQKIIELYQRARNDPTVGPLFPPYDNNLSSPAHAVTWPLLCLLFPARDVRRKYGLQDRALATALVNVFGLAKTDPAALKILHWTTYACGPDIGADLPAMAAMVLQNRLPARRSLLTVARAHELLDELASCVPRLLVWPIFVFLTIYLCSAENAHFPTWTEPVTLPHPHCGRARPFFATSWPTSHPST
ncbi:hypothetical protein AMAG_19145 [Allomyces macrogynus ATCC 38327]|uniref:DNA ligase ATP-dependent N-terminal domain-containing protein n=1 Tax=Allomyces macrogynus (strain ATCC 38327) TaxID=578462 RepID=A0A0L0SPF6_ALLM3|nr:hypothetical protein AMAG_19145 [Allomyces macrogynus ATCC 38327]|eukprot:KNE64284.1 hypothetical protein AMAG_19145 [Allomyces macrogynus ATCC 38327]